MGYGYEYVYFIMNILKLAARVSNFLTCVQQPIWKLACVAPGSTCLELKEEEEDFPVLLIQ